MRGLQLYVVMLEAMRMRSDSRYPIYVIMCVKTVRERVRRWVRG